MTGTSPLAPAGFPDLPEIKGLAMTTRAVGVKYKDRTDLFVATFPEGTTAGGVFTQSLTASAPVDYCRRNLKGGVARALIVNSGNSNAFTGKRGVSSVERIIEATSGTFGCAADEIFTSATGVIGEPLPDEKITKAITEMVSLGDACSWKDAASAIMTTDTFPKGAGATVKIGETEVNIAGIAKGSGMIAPDMATMLAYVFTDAALPHDVLQALTTEATNVSFNAITVDSDTSTSDTLMAFATAQADHAPVSDIDDPVLQDFRIAFRNVLIDLAQQIVKDGEGASKFMTVTIKGADTDEAAKKIALSVANSPLVKTAVAGEDANWGRIVMAVGKAGEKADRDKLAITIGGVTIAAHGEAVEGYDEAPVTAHMKGQYIDIDVDVGIANGSATVWTCDLTHGYISINADYRS